MSEQLAQYLAAVSLKDIFACYCHSISVFLLEWKHSVKRLGNRMPFEQLLRRAGMKQETRYPPTDMRKAPEIRCWGMFSVMVIDYPLNTSLPLENLLYLFLSPQFLQVRTA